MDDEAFLAMRARLATLLPRLNERDRRVAMAVEAISWGRGGISAVHRATGASRATIRRGMTELADDEPAPPSRRVRAPGAGRKKAEVADPKLLDALDSLVEPQTRGDPESPLRWTTKSTRNLAGELTKRGHRASHSVVAKILGSLGYTLQGTRKTPEGQQPSDRNAQFRYINGLAEQFLASGDPVISVDTQKKELVRRYAQAGKEWQGKDNPYGPHGPYDDLADDSTWACVSIDHDASVFAVATIEQWWHTMGKNKYPNARRILSTADCGGSNGHRPWPWKFELARLAAVTGLDIIVCHYPSGTSKWNNVEHRLFSRITHNRRGQPLETYQTIVNLIVNTTTPTGLATHCELDSNSYSASVKIKNTDQQRKPLPLARHQFHGDWNYTIRPSNLHSREVG
jgi:Rhodopirellula transposase DDE domain